MYIGSVIVSYNNGIIRYSYIAVQAVEERFCKMSGIPLDNASDLGNEESDRLLLHGLQSREMLYIDTGRVFLRRVE